MNAEAGLSSLGPCCACGAVAKVRSIIMLPWRGSAPGKGWGCAICGLPADGAVAVLCDKCTGGIRADRTIIKFACVGYPGDGQRTPIETLTEPFEHDKTINHDEA